MSGGRDASGCGARFLERWWLKAKLGNDDTRFDGCVGRGSSERQGVAAARAYDGSLVFDGADVLCPGDFGSEG
jgi:hypothetical protein